MAACNLIIQLDDPQTPRLGGDAVTGTVVVNCTDSVKCDGLEVSSYWTTHGRGNIDQGEIESAVVFQGTWDANREYRYPFSLKTAAWPPSYYGTYLNVSQMIRARARVPWSKDSKVEVEFPVIAHAAPEDLKPTEAANKKPTKLIGWIIGVIVLLIIVPLFGILLVFLLPLAAIGGGGYWFFRVFLPRRVTGKVECKVIPERVELGGTIRGSLRFTPQKNSTINGISWNLKCQEKCVSGSGSNRTTHLHEVFQTGQRLAESTQLAAGLPVAHEFEFAIPETASPSLKFSNNELTWTGEVRIDIPNWPDWVHTFTLTVAPTPRMPASRPAAASQPSVPPAVPHRSQGARLPTAEEEAWFHEVVKQVSESSADPSLLQTVLAAVRDQELAIRVDILDDMEQPADGQRDPGEWMSARVGAVDVELGLLFPPSFPRPAAGTFNWCARAQLIGFDSEWDCVLLRVM